MFDQNIEFLRAFEQQAVREQRFEDAARFRDQIRKLEAEGPNRFLLNLFASGKPKSEKVPSSEFSPEFLGMRSSCFPHWSIPALVHLSKLPEGPELVAMFEDEGRLILRTAAYMELVMLRSILLDVLGREVRDGEFKALVLRYEHPDGAVSYHLKSLGTGPRELAGSLILRKLSGREPLPPIRTDGRFVYGVYVSPFFVQKTP